MNRIETHNMMKGQRTRVRITSTVRQAIEEEVRRDPRAPAWQISGKVRQRLDRRNIKDLVPEERALQNIAKGVREKLALGSYDDDDLWSPRLSGQETPIEALADLLVVWKVSMAIDERFTIRKAKWASSLRFAVRASSVEPITWSEAEDLWEWSRLYAQCEYAEVDTLGLDAELAFQPWASPLHQWQYEQAVNSGVVPPSARDNPWNPSDFLTDIFYPDAEHLMKEVDQEIDFSAEWYPVAKYVLIYWLKEISGKIPRWHPVYLDELTGEDEKSWNAMEVQLAKEVVAKAKELERFVATESKHDPDGYVPWEPTETLKAVGLLEAG